MSCRPVNYTMYLFYSIGFGGSFVNFKPTINKNTNLSSLIVRVDYTIYKMELPDILTWKLISAITFTLTI